MIHSGKCPKCNVNISHGTIETIELRFGKQKFQGISYLCPSCHVVLSVSFDMLALTGDIANAVASRLGKG